MPDTELKIRITGDTKTLGDLKRELKDLKKQIDTTVAGTPEAEALNAQYRNLNADIKKAGPNWQAYQQYVKSARIEKRALRFAVVELTGAFDIFGDKSKKVTHAITSSMSAGFGAKFALDAMGKSAAAFAGPVGIGIAALSLFTQAFSNQEEKTKAATKALEDWKTMMKEAPLEVIFDEIDRLEKYLEESKKVTGVGPAAQWGFVHRLLYGGKSPEEIQEQLDFLNESIVKLTSEGSKLRIDNEEQANTIIFNARERHFKDVLELNKKYENASAQVRAFSGATPRPITGAELTRLRGSLVPVSPGESFGEKLSKQFDVGMRAQEAFTMSFLSGLDTIGAQIDTLIGRNFRVMFAEVNSALEIFLQAFLTALAEIAIKIAAIQALKLIPGIGSFLSVLGYAEGGIIPEPVIGHGLKSGMAYTFAERGPETVLPYVARNAAQANMKHFGSENFKPFVKVIPIATNQGLAVRVEIGDRRNSRGRIG